MDNNTILLITYVIIGVIAVMTVYALFSHKPGVAHNGPSILTSLGIFGTFLGITIGLAGFDPDDVRNSISYLFSGIKLAFWTSVAGILGGILVKFRHLFLFPVQPTSEVTLDDLVNAMRGVESSLTGEDRTPLLAKLSELQSQSNLKTEEIRSALGNVVTATEAARERDSAVLNQLESLGAGSKEVGQGVASLNERLAQSGAASAEQLREVAAAIEGLQAAMGGDAATMLERLDALRVGAEGVGERIAQILGSNSASLAKALEGNRDTMAAQITAAVTDLRDALVGPDGAASDLGRQIQQGQVELATALARASEGLRASVGEDVQALNERLAQSSGTTAEQMRSVAQAIEGLQSAMGGDAKALLEQMENLQQGSENLGERLSTVLGATSASLAKALEGNRDAMAAQITTAVTDLRDALVGPDGAATELGQQIKQGQIELAGALARASDGLRATVDADVSALNERLAKSSATTAQQMGDVAKAIETLQAAMGGDTKALLERLDVLGQGSETLAERLSESLGASSASLAKALEGNRDAMAAQITTAVTDVRDALVGPDGAASELATSLQQGQIDLATALARTTEGLRGAIGEDAAALLDRLDGLSAGMSDLANSVAGSFGETAGGLSGDVSNLATTVADAIDDLRMAIVGPDGARDGIAEEIRNAHADTGEKLASIHKALQENTKRQVDYSPKGLMTVLEELIKQFNTQFAGQFWGKIDGFNQAIAELLGWMETYRKQLGDMVDQQSKSARNMDTATRRFDEVASKSEIFIDVSKNLTSLLGGIDSQRVQMESHLKRFAHLVDETSTSLGNIEEKVISSRTDMNEHVREISERIEEQVIRVDRAMEEELTKALNTFGQQLAALSEKFVDDYTPLTERLRDVVNISRGV